MKKEQKFLQALKDIFVGAPVEGESGYINLMRIKATYFETGVFPRLMQDIDVATGPFDAAFREELFDKLYAFFYRYFSESGSIYFRHTPLHERVYEKVYTDDRDVMLFYKTHMLYYVKTDRLFHSMDVQVGDHRLHFDVSALEHKQANEKRALVYQFNCRRADGTIVLTVGYSERGRKTDADAILRALRQDSLRLTEDDLEQACRLFERQSEVDYFINKDARAFLREQFDLWLYQYVFEPEQATQTFWTESRIRQVQVIKDIAYRIIDFIAQFEDELVRVWNKPKFVLDSYYVITLDRIVAQGETGLALLRELLAHPGIEVQIQEWRALGMLPDNFTPDLVWQRDSLGERLHPRYQFLPLDTHHFADRETDLIALFDHLDRGIDGWLIKSENYQALNTLLPKFRASVRCIYIDPPYNSKYSEIDYRNQFKHSSWLAMMQNRLSTAANLLQPEAGLIVAIDENEQERLGMLLSALFPWYEKRCITVVHNPRGIQGNDFSYCHDYAYFVFPDSSVVSGQTPPADQWEFQNLRNWGGESRREDGRHCFYPVYVKDGSIVRLGAVPPESFHPSARNVLLPSGETEIWPIDRAGVERKWRYMRESLEKVLFATRIVQRDEQIEIELARVNIPYKTVWTDSRYDANTYGSRILEQMGSGEFTFPKSLNTVQDCVGAIAATEPESLVLDFFAGSGTTAHAVINLNREDGGQRKYILIEMADYFDTVLLPRIKKVVFSDKWKDGQAEEGQGIGHFVKVFRLEQYEDVLRRAVYADAAPLFIQADPYSQYVFLRDKKLLDTADAGQEVVTLDTDAEKVQVHLDRLYQGIDVAETLSCVTGQWVRRITRDTVEFEDGQCVDLHSPPWLLVKPLVWW